ncbi:MAG TPA: AraC family transcriptional regulator [Thermoanaerobaculia bacterium]|nr:AraC family transcriptional regulator [Thermoanaerobaculia bacterium]
MLRAGEFLGQPVRSQEQDGLTLTLYEYAASCSLPLHGHENAYLSFPLTGEYEERTASSARTCAAGRALFHPSGETHRDTFSRAGAMIFSIEIGGPWLERMRDVGFATGDRRELPPAVFAHARRELGRFLRNERPDGVDVIAALHPLSISLPPPWLERVRQALHDSSVLPPLATLARTAGVHEVHLARTFRAVHRCTIGDYFRTIRLARAVALLRDARRPLAEVALACGFSDQSHLCREVKRATGATPAQLRRR